MAECFYQKCNVRGWCEDCRVGCRHANFERFRAKAAAYLKEHENHIALQRLQRNKQLTPIRSLVGPDRAAAAEAFEHYLDGTRFSVAQVRFVNLIVDELTANGVMEPKRLFESPFTDHAPTGPDFIFSNVEDVTVLVEIIESVRQNAVPVDVA